MAVVCFAPMLWSRPGLVTDDTKTYLYLDPGRYVRAAASQWDPGVALGTVTHQNIGYLLPMGPFFWALAELHVPLWIAQRLWMGCLLFAAAAGMLYLCRTVGLTGPGRYVAAIGFTFTPYVLQYAGRISVILLPWSGLPWMIAFVILALRVGGWRYPALFALVVALVSGINASSILFVGIAPALWLPYSVLVTREATWRKAWGVAWKVGLLSALVSLWWAIGLQVEAAYGVNVLKYTETVPVTSGASLASEIVRGLGYWYFYGADRLGPWTQTSVAYTQNLWLIGASFAVPLLCFIAAVFSRWRYRSFFVFATLVGMVLAVGPNPYADPSALGSVIKSFLVDTTAGLALRSTDRASPVVILGLAMFLGAGVSALAARLRRTGLVIGAFAIGAIAGATVPLWTGGIIANGFTQPAVPPVYVRQAAAALDRTNQSTRVYALPGNNFAAYRWGDTIDTVYPGLMTRPFVTHEQQIYGSLATANLLGALDTPLIDGTMDWNALAPTASLMSAGNVLVQYDEAYERYDTANPQQVAEDLAVTPPGLSDPVSYGAPRPNVPLVPHFDEAALARPANQGWPSPLVSYTVADPRPIVRTEPTADPLVVDGDASGVVASASVGLLAGNPAILYAGTLDTTPALKKATLGAAANLVVTDTNRKQAREWNTLSENAGATETATQTPDQNPSNEPLNLFPKAPADAQSTATYSGIASVDASSYGSSITYLPEDRPYNAIDSNPQTAWEDNSFATPAGQWWQVELLHPTTESSITLIQPQTGDPDQSISKVTLTFDGGHPVTEALGAKSLTTPGQTISFPARTFTKLRITIEGVHVDNPAVPVTSRSSIGFAEVQIPGVAAQEIIAMPEDLLRSIGPASTTERLSLVMTRLRSSGTPPFYDTETALNRSFWLPSARTFSLIGSADISSLIPDDMIDRLTGRPGSNGSGIVAYSLGRLPGDLRAGAIATVDGSSSTIWEPGFGATHQAGDWLDYQLPNPITFDHLDLQIVADGQHSVPTSLTIAAGGESTKVTLPPVADSPTPGSVVDVPVSFPPLTGSNIRVTVDSARLENTPNYYSQQPIALPLGIAEVGIPGLHAAPLPQDIPSTCQGDLLTLDGKQLWVSVSGSTTAALNRQPLTVSPCGPDAGGITLGPGTHTLLSNPGQVTGFDINQLAFDSAPGGGPMALASPTSLAALTVAASPTVHVDSQTPTTIHLTVHGVSAASSQTPLNLVLGESINPGWNATVQGAGSLGTPFLIDGFANGWRLDPSSLSGAIHDGTLSIVLTWQPQKRVDLALLISLLAIVLCVVLALLPMRKRRRVARHSAHSSHSAHSGPAAEVTEEYELGATQALAEGIRLAVPFSAESPRAPVWLALLTGAITGVAAAAISSPAAGLGAGIASVVVLLVPRLRVLLGLAAIAAIAAAGSYTGIHQAALHIPSDGSWPLAFQKASRIAWVGVVLLGADAAVEVVLRRRRSD
jgi:arabinofuranan 3-O-arabinosyltransferase